MSTKIRLLWETNIDAAHFVKGLHVRIIRLYAPVCFKEATGWSPPADIIVDLGSPLTVMPKSVWQAMESVEILSEPVALGGLGKGFIMARLAKIELAFLSTRKEIVELAIKAYLAEDDSAPPLLGVEDVLTNARLVGDYPHNKAFLHIG
jgi:hypothetical protein